MKNLIQPMLNKLLGDASRLTHNGRLADATAVIQRALGAAGLMPNPAATAPQQAPSNVLDGLVREVDRPPTEPRTKPPQVGAHFDAGSCTSESGTRQYKLFVPAGFAGQALPLVVMLHGCTQNPDDFAAGTRMNERAQELGAIVLYPAQAPRSNSQKCWNWFQPGDQRRGKGEPALLAAMTRQIIASHPVDPARVYVAGLSAGGAMAAILGREYPDLFAAVGVHSGLAAGAATDVGSAFAAMASGAATAAGTGSTPVIVFHGDKDTTVHPVNGEQVIGRRAATGRGEQNEHSGRRYTRSVYCAADGQIDAEHWRVHGAGHAWSGGSAAGSYTDASGPDASREMLRFFLAHPNKHPNRHQA